MRKTTVLITFSILLYAIPVCAGRQLKVVTYNLWHGLERTGPVSVRWVLSRKINEKRILYQLDMLKRESPDVAFLQEVNPIPEIIKLVIDKLKNYQMISTVVNCGMKLFGMGHPGKLNSGLAILAKKKFTLKKVAVQKLSGPIGGCSDSFGFQTGEIRKSLVGKISVNRSEELLLVNTHLHAGIEFSPTLRSDVTDAVTERVQQAQIIDYLKNSDRRREAEIKRLEKQIRRLIRRSSYIGLILGADLNFGENSHLFKLISYFGYINSVKSEGRSIPLNTIDFETNTRRLAREESFPFFARQFQDKLSRITFERLISILTHHVNQSKRIDFVFYRPIAKYGEFFGNQLFASELTDSLGNLSDHYGLATTLEIY